MEPSSARPETLELLIGSANAGKVRELELGLAGLPLRIQTVADFNLVEPDEVGETFNENALIKGRYYFRKTGLFTLADDSGLEVDCLGGRPGVLTARFGGPGLSDAERLFHLLKKLQDANNRRARFVCVIALVGRDFSTVVRGDCNGQIALEPAGTGGFGYDPVFIPDGFSQTFAQLPSSVKATVSHRGKAIAAARRVLESRF
jgi:XTP/dITP diphosphohydrolase